MNTFPTQLIATIAALVIVLVIAWLCIKLLAQVTKKSRAGYRIKVIESVPVGTRERLVLASIDGEELLLGVTADSVTLLRRTSADNLVNKR